VLSGFRGPFCRCDTAQPRSLRKKKPDPWPKPVPLLLPPVLRSPFSALDGRSMPPSMPVPRHRPSVVRLPRVRREGRAVRRKAQAVRARRQTNTHRLPWNRGGKQNQQRINPKVGKQLQRARALQTNALGCAEWLSNAILRHVPVQHEACGAASVRQEAKDASVRAK